TQLQATHLVVVVVLRGKEDYGNARAFTKAAHHFEAAHLRHHDVEHYDVRALLLRKSKRLFAVTGHYNTKSLAGELKLNQPEDSGFIVDGEEKCSDRNGRPLPAPNPNIPIRPCGEKSKGRDELWLPAGQLPRRVTSTDYRR